MPQYRIKEIVSQTSGSTFRCEILSPLQRWEDLGVFFSTKEGATAHLKSLETFVPKPDFVIHEYKSNNPGPQMLHD